MARSDHDVKICLTVNLGFWKGVRDYVKSMFFSRRENSGNSKMAINVVLDLAPPALKGAALSMPQLTPHLTRDMYQIHLRKGIRIQS